MDKKEQFENFVKVLPSKVKQNLVERGSLMPVVFVFGDSGMGVIGIPDFPNNEAEKEELADTIREIATKDNAVGVVMISEGWCANVNKDTDLRRIGSISARPDRKEVVFVREEFKGKPAKMSLYDIVRDIKGKAVDLIFTDSMEDDKEGKSGGIFTDFLGKPRGIGRKGYSVSGGINTAISMN